MLILLALFSIWMIYENVILTRKVLRDCRLSEEAEVADYIQFDNVDNSIQILSINSVN